MTPYRHTYRHVYFDNFFSSIALLIDLLKEGLYGCGTVRTNRKGYPESLKTLVKKGLGERGRSKILQHGNITATVWQDNKPVPAIASNGDPTTPTEGTRMAAELLFHVPNPLNYTTDVWVALTGMTNFEAT